VLPIEIRELLIEPPHDPAAASSPPEPTAMPSATDAARVLEGLHRSRAERADRLRAD
jgi:hypothetical protein